MGVSGAGKSSLASQLAERFSRTYIEADSLHPAANIARMRSGLALRDDDRLPWLEAVATAAARSRKPTVIACSALKRRYRERLRERLGSHALLLIFLDPNEALLRDRLARRQGHFMPATLLDSQLKTLEPPTAQELAVRFDGNSSTPRIVEVFAAYCGNGAS